MRFTCDACSAKYSIADDRVKGRILKIRCKACNHIITVREEEKSKSTRLPVSPPAAPVENRRSATQDAIESAFGPPPDESEHTMVSSNPGLLLELQKATEKPAAAAASVDEWFISFDGDQEGPLSVQKARERIAVELPKGRECFAWKAGFFVWLPVEEVPELKDAAPKKAAPIPPMPAATGNGHGAAAASAKSGEAPAIPTGPAARNGHTGNGAGGDLLITEASALINLDHLRAAAMAKPAAPKTPGPAVGPTATFDPLPSNVAPVPSSGTPAPVVVMTGPAPKRTSGAVKWVAVLGVCLTLGLGGSLAYVLVTRSNANPIVTTPSEPTNKKADDRPIQFIDPTNPQPQPVPGDPKAPIAAKKTVAAANPGTKTTPTTPNPAATKAGGPQLNAAQKGLASLYAEDGDTTSPRALSAGERKEKSNGQVDILSVVTQNKRSLNMCYERVLKRDNTLKRARVVTQVKVGMSGIVKQVTIPDPQYSDSEIGQCLTQAIKKWRFPSQDSEYETEFPILLQAE